MSDRAGTRKQASALAAQGERPIGTDPAGGVGADVSDCRDPDRAGGGVVVIFGRFVFGHFVFARTARQSLLEG
jgi:hypothetical protein